MKLKVVNMPVLLKEMQAAGLDAAVVASPENFFYLSGWKIQTSLHSWAESLRTSRALHRISLAAWRALPSIGYHR